MLAETRRRQLLERIQLRGFATLEELVRGLGVSESTVRRDLEALDLSGAIKRTHGGAICSGDLRAMPALDDRASAQAVEKQAIGRAAANEIEDGETVLLDGGTTTLEVARALVGRAIQVVTNSLPIASKETDLILIGGYIYPRTGVAMGPLSIASLEGIRVRKSILGAGGIVAEGVFNSNSLLVETERRMMECGQEVILVADSSKFGRLALSKLCGLEEIDLLITDPAIKDEHRSWLADAGVTTRIASLAEPEQTPSRSPSNGLPTRIETP
jgi:DeoR/GlpR family transcriptional regulator of sugar metabolism